MFEFEGKKIEKKNKTNKEKEIFVKQYSSILSHKTEH